MSDRVSSSDTRVEFDAQGKLLMVSHVTSAPLTTGRGMAVEVGGIPVAVVGSTGLTRTGHRLPSIGQALAPLPLACTIRSGCDWFLIDDNAIARPSSHVSVPDAFQSIKQGVLETENDFFLVGDEPAVRLG